MSKHLGRPGRLALEHRLGGAREPLENGRVELVGIDPERVTGRTRTQHSARPVVRSRRLESRPQLGDVEPELAAAL
jgi:hypothetical protein